MISWRPALGMVDRLIGGKARDPESVAHEWWRIAEPEVRRVPPAILLPDQIARIRVCEFGTIPEVVHHLRGGFEMREGPTLGYALRAADLVDGVLYAGRARRSLRPGARARPFHAVPEARTSGVLYESWVGNRWFGNWLSDDCLCYALATRFGVPVASVPAPGGHAAAYEARLGQRPRRFDRVRFDELILINDHANNADRRARATRMRARLLLGIAAPERPGVFLLRGESGDRRLLANELEIAGRLRDTFGFLVIDPTRMEVPEILAACGGARIVAGVEGSQLVHGLIVLPPDGVLLTLQPPDRVTSVLKIATDRQGQGFAMLVGEGDKTGFRIRWDEVVATLRLIEASRGV